MVTRVTIIGFLEFCIAEFQEEGGNKVMATRKDVAKQAGVSEATVSYVINNTKNITPVVKKRVLDAVDNLGYRPNQVARSLVTKQTKHVAMLVDNLMNPYYCEMLEGAQSVASDNGYIVSVISIDVSNEESVLELASRGVDGVILAIGTKSVDNYFKTGLPKVYMGKYVTMSYRKAIFEMVECLVNKGHKKIAFLSGIPLSHLSHERYYALKDACSAYGIGLDPDLVIDANEKGKTDEKSGEEAMEELFARKKDFTAVYTVNDLMAVGAAKAIRRHGLKIPDDISLIGCDNIKLFDTYNPRLATMDAHAFEAGEYLMRLLIEKITGQLKISHEIQADFICKESIGEVKTGV